MLAVRREAGPIELDRHVMRDTRLVGKGDPVPDNDSLVGDRIEWVYCARRSARYEDVGWGDVGERTEPGATVDLLRCHINHRLLQILPTRDCHVAEINLVQEFELGPNEGAGIRIIVHVGLDDLKGDVSEAGLYLGFGGLFDEPANFPSDPSQYPLPVVQGRVILPQAVPVGTDSVRGITSRVIGWRGDKGEGGIRDLQSPRGQVKRK